MTALAPEVTAAVRVHAVVDQSDNVSCCCPSAPQWAVQWKSHQIHPILLCNHHWSKNVGLLIPGAARCYPLHKQPDPYGSDDEVLYEDDDTAY